MNVYDMADFLNNILQIDTIRDDSLNGLQIANSGSPVRKIALAVDACNSSFTEAANMGADMIVVHHGLFWAQPAALTGLMYKRCKILMDKDIGLYTAHLPLDAHPVYGNNACAEKILGWKSNGDFGDYKGITLGKAFTFNPAVSYSSVLEELKNKLKSPAAGWAFGPENIHKAAYVSGGGIGLLDQAIDNGFDLLITGEPKHGSFWQAREASINVIFAGHYATETLGVKAIGRLLTEKFGIETVFIDLPTGH